MWNNEALDGASHKPKSVIAISSGSLTWCSWCWKSRGDLNSSRRGRLNLPLQTDLCCFFHFRTFWGALGPRMGVKSRGARLTGELLLPSLLTMNPGTPGMSWITLAALIPTVMCFCCLYGSGGAPYSCKIFLLLSKADKRSALLLMFNHGISPQDQQMTGAWLMLD